MARKVISGTHADLEHVFEEAVAAGNLPFMLVRLEQERHDLRRRLRGLARPARSDARHRIRDLNARITTLKAEIRRERQALQVAAEQQERVRQRSKRGPLVNTALLRRLMSSHPPDSP
jgi:chromosome segregation ATPase